MWAYCEGNVVIKRVSELPSVWGQISNFGALDTTTLKSYGWLPFTQNRPTYDSNTEELQSLGYAVGADSVVEEFAIVAKQPVTPSTVMSKLAFRSRFTVAELVAIEVARLTAEDMTIRATLNVLADNMALAEEIDIADARTILGINTLVALGLLTQARADEILG